MTQKGRLSASVDASLLHAAEAAVAAGRSSSMSSWVNDALRLKLEHDRRLVALEHFIREHEAAHGVITKQEMAGAARRARGRAIPIRGRRKRAA